MNFAVLWYYLSSPMRRVSKERERKSVCVCVCKHVYVYLDLFHIKLWAYYYFTRRRTTMVIPRQIITGFRLAPEFRLSSMLLPFCHAAPHRTGSFPWQEGRPINVAPVTTSRGKLHCGDVSTKLRLGRPVNRTASRMSLFTKILSANMRQVRYVWATNGNLVCLDI